MRFLPSATSLSLATMFTVVKFVSAHGYVSLPPSRQARCMDDNIPGCGDVRYEPQSVEAFHGSFLCNGNGARFPELNDESLWKGYFFNVPTGSNHLPFTWTITASHRTPTIEYFIFGVNGNPTLLASFDYNDETVPAILTHDVPLQNYSGNRTILGRWKVANSFHSCVDLLIPGTV